MHKFEEKVWITIYAPMIYKAPCIMFWMRAYPMRGQVGGGWTLEFENFLVPFKWLEPIGECHLGPKELEPWAQPPPTCPSNRYARIQNIMHRAV
jgi:hypothetical protein